MRSSYKKEDVEILLKEVTGMIKPLDTLEREKLIQSGRHYSEFLPLEYRPTDEYIRIYEEALDKNAKLTADAVSLVAEKILKVKGENVVIVSLARAGTPIGILIKRYIKKKYNIDIKHYTISIIRDRGIDKKAISYILSKHKASDIQFVDGWIGKGAIINELKKEMKEYSDISANLAVLSDPAGLTSLYGTKEDFLIPSSCLNATVSGLFSRTILNDDIIDENDYHGSVFYEELLKEDRSNEFLDTIEKQFDTSISIEETFDTNTIVENKEIVDILQNNKDIASIKEKFNIKNINFIKPGIGETTRVLLRRIPYMVLIGENVADNEIEHILRLCKEKNVKTKTYPLVNYKVCGIIKNMSDV